MSHMDDNYLTRAEMLWENGQSLEAGKLIFQRLPVETRPKWAASILRLIVDRSSIALPVVESVLRIASDPVGWKEAHRAFSALREATLELEKLERFCSISREQIAQLMTLLLAENVAKVIYNASGPPDEFDDDSGWWIVACLRDLVDFWNDANFAKAAWQAVSIANLPNQSQDLGSPLE